MLVHVLVLLLGLSVTPEASRVVRFEGELTSGDWKLKTGEFYDVFRFTAPAGQQLTVTMTSEDFDTYLIVQTGEGEQEDNDDAGSNRRSEIVVEPTAAWTYRILPTSYKEGVEGRYVVTATLSP